MKCLTVRRPPGPAHVTIPAEALDNALNAVRRVAVLLEGWLRAHTAEVAGAAIAPVTGIAAAAAAECARATAEIHSGITKAMTGVAAEIHSGITTARADVAAIAEQYQKGIP